MAKRIFPVLFLVFFIAILFFSCEEFLPNAPASDETLDGPIDGLSHEQSLLHLKGDAAFNDQVFTVQTGLGSIFVATSCGSCHAVDGKGHPFTTLTRFGQTDETGNQFLNQGGPQLQNRATPGFVPEQIPVGATHSDFTPPSNTGLGFIELVSDADILAMADPGDLDGDGISGVPNWTIIPSYISPTENSIVQDGKYICRFGKKASAFNLLHQTVNAYNQDIGITSVFNLLDVYSHLEIDPEISVNTIHDVIFYLQTLKAPIPRNQQDADVQQGKNIFIQIGCENCHKQTLKTTLSSIMALSAQEFHPYTDLLLHDMGTDLDDGYTEGSAKTYEWRTPPLWGLGLAPKSQGGQYYLLHDGRARSIHDAVVLHGGEAENNRTQYTQLTESDREKVIRFLESL